MVKLSSNYIMYASENCLDCDRIESLFESQAEYS